jgi:hypothetical protein
MKVEIAPNNAEKTTAVARGEGEFEGQEPKVGEHEVKEDNPISGIHRHSHHAPENQLSKDLSMYYLKIGEQLNNNSDFAEEAQQCIDRSNLITNGTYKNGKKLSAILISEEAHKKNKDAVHRVNTDSVVSQIRSELGDDEKRFLLKKKNGDIYSSIRSAQWQNFIREIFSYQQSLNDVNIQTELDESEGILTVEGGDKKAIDAVAAVVKEKVEDYGTLSIEDKEDNKSGILRLINSSAFKSYNQAINNSITNLKIALSNSGKDGNTSLHDDKLDELRDKAEEIWEDKIVNPI